MTTSTLLINEPPLQVLPSLALRIGLNEAIIVQQVHYWLNPKFNKNYFEGRHWVWNTYEQWQQQFPFWGMNTIRRAIGNLEESRILISFVTRDFKKLKYYSIDYDLLQNFVSNAVGHTQKTAENMATCPSAQNGQTDLLKSTDRADQNGQADRPNMGRSYNKDTEITHSENTLLPSQKDEDDEKIQTMLFIWNETVQKKINPNIAIHLTPKRQAAMTACLIDVFGQDMTAWLAYCESIAQNGFLMGESTSGFKASLDWSIKIDNAYKVLEGAIYDKSPKLPAPVGPTTKSETLEYVQTKINLLGSDHRWLKVSSELIEQLSLGTFQAWLMNAEFKIDQVDRAVISVDSLFFQDFIRSKFLEDIEEVIKAIIPEIRSVSVEIRKSGGGHEH